MPCYTRSESTIAVDKMDAGLATTAIRAAGLYRHITYQNGTLTSYTLTITEEHKTQIKRAYSAEVVKATAKKFEKFGWQTKQIAPFKFEIVKTTY